MENSKDSNEEIKKLIRKTIKLYTKMRDEKEISNRVKRGRQSSIASKFEDSFASLYLEKKIPECYQILIDFPISYKDDIGDKTKIIYPDICIVDSTQLYGIIELKIDLGYTPDNWIKDLETKYKPLNEVDYIKIRHSDIKVKKNFPVLVVLLTGKNDRGGKLQNFLRNDNCFVISKNHHPNDEKVKYNDIIYDEENLQNWEKLDKSLNSFSRCQHLK